VQINFVDNFRKEDDLAQRDVILEQTMESYSDFLPSLASRRFDKKLTIKEDSYLVSNFTKQLHKCIFRSF